MDKVFEVKDIDLVDLSGDTHFMTDIQSRVLDMLRAGKGHQAQLRDQILQEGPRVLPGVLNATYVRELHTEREKQLVAELLAELTRGNAAAREMLLERGILRVPFVSTRQVAILALQQLGEFSAGELDQIREYAFRDLGRRDYEAALVLLELLAQHKDEKAGAALEVLARELCQGRVDVGPRFLDLALICVPQQAYQILTNVLATIRRDDKEFGKRISECMTPQAVAELPEILRAADSIKRKAEGYAHKPVENLFTGPVAAYLSMHPDRIEDTGDLVEKRYEPLYRYWWEGLAQILELEPVRQYFESRIVTPLGNFAWYGGLQLCFIRGSFNPALRVWAQERWDSLDPDEQEELTDKAARFRRLPDGADPERSRPGGLRESR